MTDKPPYRVPSMSEIENTPWNGYNVVSTFSGAGGSCLGYRIAGYRVLWASEFMDAAQEVYKLNHPDSILDPRDIRTIDGQEILNAIKMNRGEVDILDGSPPCSAFSLLGVRDKAWGQEKHYSETTFQRVDDLFFEYVRLVQDIQPKIFVAENVSGLVRGKAKGYFKMILKALGHCGYTVKAKLLNARWLGVPQMRERLFFIGVRNDLKREPIFPDPLPYEYTIADAWGAEQIEGLCRPLPEGTKLRLLWDKFDPTKDRYFRTVSERMFNRPNTFFSHVKIQPYQVCNTITALSNAVYHPTIPRTLTIPELKRVQGFPDDFQLTGSFTQQWERLGRSVPPVMMNRVASELLPILEDK